MPEDHYGVPDCAAYETRAEGDGRGGRVIVSARMTAPPSATAADETVRFAKV